MTDIIHSIYFKLSIMAICAGLKFIGEIFWHDAQRFIMPIVLGIGISISSFVWWLGFTTLPIIADITQGYGPKSWMYKLLGDAGARGMWLFLAALITGAGPFFTDHLHWYLYAPYAIGAGILGATTRGLWNKIIAPITGAWLGAIVLLVH